MQKIIARSLLALERKQVFDFLPEVFELVLDDDTVITTTRELTYYSRYIWMIHECLPNTPILYKHCLDSLVSDKALDSKTHIKLITEAQTTAIECYGLIDPQSREKIQELAFRIPNLILNEIYGRAQRFVTTIDITDFLELSDYQPMVDIRNKLKHDDPFIDDTIRQAYSESQSVVMNDPALDNNNLVAAVRCGMVSANQFVQCSVARGVPSYKNGLVMAEPILSDFTRGMYRLYDLLAEGQSAAKAMDMQEEPLKETEYFARRLQLLTMTVRRVHMGDCGSRDYTPWRMLPARYDGRGKVTARDDLSNFVGKYYLDEENSTDTKHVYKVIGEGDKHLYGKLLFLRVAYRCKHPDKYGVCSTCFGKLAMNVSRYANLGHICAATMTQQSSQSVLSTKHLDASSTAADIELNIASQKFFTTNSKKSAVFFRPEMKGSVMQLSVPQAETVGLVDVRILPWDKINPNRVSEIATIELGVMTRRNEFVKHVIEIKQSDRSAIFTIEFLEFLKEKGWTTDSRNMFVIELEGWDFNKPIFKFPDVEYSYSDHSKQIANLIEQRKLKSDLKNVITSADILHQELFRLVNSKLNVTSSCLEVIIYSLMVDGPNSFGMGRNAPVETLASADRIIRNRTLSTAYGYKLVADTLKSPESFFNKGRPSSVFDALIAPYEVVQEVRHGLR